MLLLLLDIAVSQLQNRTFMGPDHKGFILGSVLATNPRNIRCALLLLLDDLIHSLQNNNNNKSETAVIMVVMVVIMDGACPQSSQQPFHHLGAAQH